MKKLLQLFLLVTITACSSQTGDYKPTVIAHRSASGYLPEHTLAALAMAHSFDVDFLEPDIVLTKDDVPVVMHDHSLNTSTDVAKKFPNRHRADGDYYVIDFTLAEIKTLVVHERRKDDMVTPIYPNRFPSIDTVTGMQIPTFEEWVLTVQGMNKSRRKNIGIYPEIKEPSFHEREGKDPLNIVIDILTKYGYNKEDGNAVLQYFDYEAVKKTKALGWKGKVTMLICTEGGQALTDDKDVHIWLTTEEGIKELSKYADAYSPWIGSLIVADDSKKGYKLSEVIPLLRKYGLELVGWTYRIEETVAPLKTPEEFLDVAFKEIKMDTLFSDNSDVVVEYLKANNMR